MSGSKASHRKKAKTGATSAPDATFPWGAAAVMLGGVAVIVFSCTGSQEAFPYGRVPAGAAGAAFFFAGILYLSGYLATVGLLPFPELTAQALAAALVSCFAAVPISIALRAASVREAAPLFFGVVLLGGMAIWLWARAIRTVVQLRRHGGRAR